MFQYVHHVHYVVENRDAMVDYLEKNFAMKPDHLAVNPKAREALYNIGQTQIQIVEPFDRISGSGKHLAQHGPGVTHVAWAVDNIQKIAQELSEKGSKTAQEKVASSDGQLHKSGTDSRDYRTFNIDPAASHGVKIELVGSK